MTLTTSLSGTSPTSAQRLRGWDERRHAIAQAVEKAGCTLGLPDSRGQKPGEYPGMPEAGYLPIPARLARAGVKEMVRISGARMSGMAYGSIVLHMTADAASGSPLAKVINGDRVRRSVAKKRLNLMVSPEELARRSVTPPPVPERGYARLYRREILQPNRGCDFDFLRKHPAREGLR